MTIAVRLNPELEQALDAYCKREGVSKSQVVKDSLRQYLSREAPPGDAYTIGQHLFGLWGSGDGGLSAERKARFQGVVRAKHAGR